MMKSAPRTYETKNHSTTPHFQNWRTLPVRHF